MGYYIIVICIVALVMLIVQGFKKTVASTEYYPNDIERGDMPHPEKASYEEIKDWLSLHNDTSQVEYYRMLVTEKYRNTPAEVRALIGRRIEYLPLLDTEDAFSDEEAKEYAFWKEAKALAKSRAQQQKP